MIAAQSGVINNIPDGTALLGSPAIEANQGKRAYSMIQYLPEMRQNIRKVEKRVSVLLEKPEKS
jgi:UDP-3-O-[3-hydroxymyristoyl] glucosamine N-acyltransferase